jgi:hypothetical protein
MLPKWKIKASNDRKRKLLPTYAHVAVLRLQTSVFVSVIAESESLSDQDKSTTLTKLTNKIFRVGPDPRWCLGC